MRPRLALHGLILAAALAAGCVAAAPVPPDFSVQVTELLPAPAGKNKWFQPRPLALPPYDRAPHVVMTIQQALGSDFYTALSALETRDGGRTWSPPTEWAGSGWRPGPAGLIIGVCDITLGWHAPTRKVIGIGHTATYTARGFAGIEHRRDTVWITYDPATGRWTPWEILAFPESADRRTFLNGVHGQWLVEPDGSLLVPFYFLPPGKADKAWRFSFRGAVARLRFDGRTLAYVAEGRELTLDVPRGVYEKSLTWHGGRYFMTIRNDQRGYVTVSDNGLDFAPIRPWTFDDGSDLGSHNTHQKWVAHSDGLFLVYTRRGANNDHIPRNRAPLFMARVDPDKLHVIRASERVVVPEGGQDLGNFDATAVSADETWITTAGAAAYLARIRWSRPNGLVGRVH
jgi:hypothetical protein